MTKSIMGVQKFATTRNAQVEQLIHFLIKKFVTRLAEQNLIKSYSTPLLQKEFKQIDCNDIFDHYLEVTLNDDSILQIWGQTTCYKGNATGKPEPNKTYEIRETLIESLNLRKWLTNSNENFRTIHFTVGSEKYTYDWFKSAKSTAFDFSWYPSSEINIDHVFIELSNLFDQNKQLFKLNTAFNKELEKGSMLSKFMHILLADLTKWFTYNLYQKNTLADLQVVAMNKLENTQAAALTHALNPSHQLSKDIKNNALKLIQGDTEADDHYMVATLTKMLSKNPFLKQAIEVLGEWSLWTSTIEELMQSAHKLEEYLSHLWESEKYRPIIRRVLFRIHSETSVNYIQDLSILDVTEHNLYINTFSAEVNQQIIQLLLDLYSPRVQSPEELFELLTNKNTKKTIQASLKYEGKNGTSIKPSFNYVEEYLNTSFEVRNFKKTKLDAPIGYHASFDETSTVKAYTNFKVIVDNDQPIAILKAKYFSKNEFMRRAKEEAYVGLTLTFKLENGQLLERYPNIPLIMFIDKTSSFEPPAAAIRKLVNAGWHVFFDLNELEKFLENLKQ